MESEIHTHTLKYYLAIKNNEIMPFVATWMDLEIITVSGVRERQIPYDITCLDAGIPPR